MTINHAEEFKSRFSPIAGRVLVLVPASDPENAIQVFQALGGAGFVAVQANRYPTIPQLADVAQRIRSTFGLFR